MTLQRVTKKCIDHDGCNDFKTAQNRKDKMFSVTLMILKLYCPEISITCASDFINNSITPYYNNANGTSKSFSGATFKEYVS